MARSNKCIVCGKRIEGGENKFCKKCIKKSFKVRLAAIIRERKESFKKWEEKSGKNRLD